MIAPRTPRPKLRRFRLRRTRPDVLQDILDRRHATEAERAARRVDPLGIDEDLIRDGHHRTTTTTAETAAAGDEPEHTAEELAAFEELEASWEAERAARDAAEQILAHAVWEETSYASDAANAAGLARGAGVYGTAASGHEQTLDDVAAARQALAGLPAETRAWAEQFQRYTGRPVTLPELRYHRPEARPAGWVAAAEQTEATLRAQVADALAKLPEESRDQTREQILTTLARADDPAARAALDRLRAHLTPPADTDTSTTEAGTETVGTETAGTEAAGTEAAAAAAPGGPEPVEGSTGRGEHAHDAVEPESGSAEYELWLDEQRTAEVGAVDTAAADEVDDAEVQAWNEQAARVRAQGKAEREQSLMASLAPLPPEARTQLLDDLAARTVGAEARADLDRMRAALDQLPTTTRSSTASAPAGGTGSDATTTTTAAAACESAGTAREQAQPPPTTGTVSPYDVRDEHGTHPTAGRPAIGREAGHEADDLDDGTGL